MSFLFWQILTKKLTCRLGLCLARLRLGCYRERRSSLTSYALAPRIVWIIYIFQQLPTIDNKLNFCLNSVGQKVLGKKHLRSRLNDDENDYHSIFFNWCSISVGASEVRPVTSISLRRDHKRWTGHLKSSFVVEIGCLKRGEIWFWEKWWKLNFIGQILFTECYSDAAG